MKSFFIRAWVAVCAMTAVALGAQAAEGESLYKRCISCHGAAGEKVYAAKVPAIAGMEKGYLIEVLQGYKLGTVNLYGMGPVMSAQTRMVLKSDEQIEAISDYISQLPKPE